MKFLHEPLLHFLSIGAVIYLLYAMFAETPVVVTEQTLVVSQAETEWMQSAWQKRWNRPPTAAELDTLVEQYIKESVLSREAINIGLDKEDTVIRRRLAQKLEFLAQDLVAFNTPTESELKSYFSAHQEEYQQAPRYTFSQVFIDPDQRGDTTLSDAETIKQQLIKQADALQNLAAFGDSFMLQNYYPENTQADIQKRFGSGFAASLVALAPQQWQGPVLSGYGVHLVYLQAIIKEPVTELATVRARVLQDWEADKRESLNHLFYQKLKEQYRIVIEDPTVVTAMQTSQP